MSNTGAHKEEKSKEFYFILNGYLSCLCVSDSGTEHTNIEDSGIPISDVSAHSSVSTEGID